MLPGHQRRQPNPIGRHTGLERAEPEWLLEIYKIKVCTDATGGPLEHLQRRLPLPRLRRERGGEERDGGGEFFFLEVNGFGLH